MITPLPPLHCFVSRPSLGRSRIASMRTIEGNTRFSIGSSVGVIFAFATAEPGDVAPCARLQPTMSAAMKRTLRMLRRDNEFIGVAMLRKEAIPPSDASGKGEHAI